MATRVQLAKLIEAHDWVSAVGPFENAAYVSRESGKIWLVSDFDDAGEEPPEDVGDETLYLAVPGKNELDLGRDLALRFADEHLPQSANAVRGFFSRPGAYRNFKDLLEARGVLDAWYAYESEGVKEALRAWAAENALELIEEDVPAAGRVDPPSNLAVVEVKAFVPARDFALSMEFYQALGFTRASVDEGIAYFHCGESSFLLQDFYVREHADNFQMHLLVEDVESWYQKAKEVAGRFDVRIGEPEDRPWAMRDFPLFDPSGVLWRIAQNIQKRQ